MEILKVGDYYCVKNGEAFVGGKFDSEDTAQLAVDNLPVYLFESVWIYALSNGQACIAVEDVNALLLSMAK
ncbi:hypothetical protein [Klebsiella quasipneumoniae]|uniref:hypothetical protein n=1 Tax=Klebsiella quasipneumoniae TaxID=1463165 RepID=UPI00287666FF|nr:hypothetical protein [Klebsiella quasipneumoniae]MDS0453230.1 hypothetical protein [Klebsiella quasipneumoniae]MDS0480535.1 hypothetical protein [Klebsiella quasipneumoniae]